VTNRQFVVDFLLRTYKIPDKAVLGIAVAQALGAIERAQKDKDRPTMHFQVTGDAGTTALSSESEYLVHRLLPLIDQLDPQWAQRVREKYKGVSAGSLDTPGTVAGASGGSTGAAVRGALDMSTASQAMALAKLDPARALQLALSITDPDQRNAALASVLPAYSSVDQKAGSAGMQDLAAQIDGMKAGIGKLQLMVNLINGYFALGRDKEAQAMIGRAFDLGEELVVRDLEANPGKMAYSASGFDQVMGLAETTASRPGSSYDLLARIRLVRSEVIRANLLSSMAKGLFNTAQSHGA
jgi:hypothetical protein